jgi:Peptidase U49
LPLTACYGPSRTTRLKTELTNVEDLADFDWPNDAPFPQEGMRFTNVVDKTAFDLICMVGGYIFLHEIRHAQLWRDGLTPAEIRDEELVLLNPFRSMLLQI